MTILWPQLSKSKNAYGEPTEEHTTYLFPSVDGYMANTDSAYAELWLAGTKTGQAYQYLNTYQPTDGPPGLNNVVTDYIYVPALPDVSFYVDFFGYVDTGLHKTSLRVRCLGSNTGLDTAGNNDWTRSLISIVGSNTDLNEIVPAGTYTDRNAVPANEGEVMKEYATSNETYYRPANHFVETDSYEDDYEGESIRWSIHADAVDQATTGDTFQAHSEIWTRELYQSTLLHNNQNGWTSLVLATDASAQYSSNEYRYDTMLTVGTESSTSTIHRAFFTFDMSEFTGGTRTATAADFKIVGYHSGADNGTDVILQLSDHTEVEGVLSKTGYLPTRAAASTDYTWYQSNSVAFTNHILLNTAGLGELNTKFSSGDELRYCLREYSHDYSDVEPGATTYTNGMYLSESINYGPRIEVTYQKVPDWDDRTVEGDWTVWGGSWNGAGWDDDGYVPGPSVIIDANGGWNADKRWSAFRVYFTGVTNMYYYFTAYYDATWSDVMEGVITSGETITIEWPVGINSDYDFDEFWFFDNDGAGNFTIDKIEFLER